MVAAETRTETRAAHSDVLPRRVRVGVYAYATGTTPGYANPDAAVSIATSTLAYDENGNLLSVTSADSGTFFAWDYRNRLTQVGDGSVTSTYAYDFADQRVKVTTGGASTYFPSRFYNVSSGGAPVKHIFANGEVVATVSGSGDSAAVTWVHTDHLGGTNVVTDADGNVSETLDYYPYGSPRLDEQTGGVNEQRKFIGEEYDPSGLSYLNARFYNGANGKFLSQDPTFLAMGDTGQLRQLTSQELQTMKRLSSHRWKQRRTSGGSGSAYEAHAVVTSVAERVPFLHSRGMPLFPAPRRLH